MTDDKQEVVVFLKNGERVIIPDIQHWFCDIGNENIHLLFKEGELAKRAIFRSDAIAGYIVPSN